MLADITLKEFLLWLLRKRKRFRVVGHSMLPLLKPGEEVLIDPAIQETQHLQIGDLVVAQHPTQGNLQVIKRVSFISATGNYFLVGDNPQESTDSRSFGSVSLEQIVGRVTCRFG
ncbi:MAG: nickel-type superoxide dismutase maturation protease [Cyanobacteria bacterium]|jgi:nickel-type superoxide dismutase maturation protease|nr:nickel-type superoxide dismutase maturation protease [Cyanobacteria bacterium GSL.Bin1]